VKLQRLGLLLAAWVVLVLAPGIVIAAQYDSYHTAGQTSWVFWFWIGGYVAQFAVFLIASKMTGRSNFLANTVAALLPLALDFEAPRRWWTVPVCAAIALATAGEMYIAEYRRDQLRQNGIRATGTVLQVVEPKIWNVIVNSAYIYRTVRLRVTRSDGVAPYEHKMRGLYMFGNVPDEGDKFALRVDPDDPNHFIVVHESLSGTNDRGGTRHTDWHVKGTAHQQPPRQQPPQRQPLPHVSTAPDGHPVDDLGTAIDKLARLHASGQLTDVEFSQAKAKLLA
jgi:hypothetical protein